MVMTTMTMMMIMRMMLMITMAMTMMIQLLSGYASGDQQATDALTKYTWIIIPVVNPDGYMYTWSTVRRLSL